MNYYTHEGFEKLKKEYEQVKAEIAIIKDEKQIKMIKDYYQKLDYQLHNAIIIEETEEYKNWDGRTIIRKCEVELTINDEESRIYTILGYNEGNILFRTLSCDSPFVLSLLGHKIGETTIFDNMKITINNVSKLVNKEKKLKRIK